MPNYLHFSCSPFEIYAFVLGPFQTNCYVLQASSGGAALVIDPADSPQEILAFLADKKLQCEAVVLTHGHCDHIAGACELAAKGLPIYIHALDAPKLSDPELSGAHFFGFPQTVCKAQRLLQEDDTLDVGPHKEAFRVMHTPGHSAGSICLVADGLAFVGDLLFDGSIGRTDLIDGDDKAMVKSLQKILQLPESTTIFSGHGPATTLADEREQNPFLIPLLDSPHR